MCIDKCKEKFGGDVECYSNKTSAKHLKSEYIIEKNNKLDQFCRILIDGCIIKENKRCDYLFIRCDFQQYYFVELKGKNIKEAYNQLKHTIYYFQNTYKLSFEYIYGRIICSKIPRGTDTQFYYRQFIKERLGNDLKITSRKLIEK